MSEQKLFSDYLRRKAQRVFQFPSNSNPGKVYTVVFWIDDWKQFKRGMITCNCPAWLFNKSPLENRECKHTREVMAIIMREAMVNV